LIFFVENKPLFEVTKFFFVKPAQNSFCRGNIGDDRLLDLESWVFNQKICSSTMKPMELTLIVIFVVVKFLEFLNL